MRRLVLAGAAATVVAAAGGTVALRRRRVRPLLRGREAFAWPEVTDDGLYGRLGNLNLGGFVYPEVASA